MKKTITEKGFEEYLRKEGYSEFTKSGHPSTVYNYPKRVKKICERENLQSLNELAEKIPTIVQKYDKNGEESAYGARSDSAYINALKRFHEFINS